MNYHLPGPHRYDFGVEISLEMKKARLPILQVDASFQMLSSRCENGDGCRVT